MQSRLKRCVALLTMCCASGCATLAPPQADTLAAAVTLRHAGREQEAAAMIQNEIIAGHGSAALQSELARDLVFSDPHRALELLEQVFDPAAPDPRLLNIAAIAKDLIGDHAEAQNIYRRALAIAPGDPAIRRNLEISLGMTDDKIANR